MGYSFYKINSKILKFDIKKDYEKIIFNHYIIRKENINRLNEDLENGQFKLSINSVAKDLGISSSKAYRIIKEFEEIGIIKLIRKGSTQNKFSIYEYIVDSNKTSMNKTDYNIDNEIDNTSNNNNSDTLYKIDNEIDFENSKKETLKKDSKNNIYTLVIDYLNKKTDKNFKATTKKTKSIINARLNEGFELEDFYKVIDIKSSQWLYSDMCKYLRPETLFSNKFEGYLNEKGKDNKELDKNNDESWDVKFEY